eukprot:TRINITY_DN5858_c0_g1_i1.p1 TRINITY_DN5858_c0_g1~~TRINITY_DN5858_c0_g1_i1.p1  ORF type:complete len:175 (-),score=23.55 TRINITY_DN5858_c0_g1_i1:27-551(-)
MPPKKKEGGSRKAHSNFVSPFAEAPPAPTELSTRRQERWVKIQVKLVTWNYLNFQIRVPAATNLYIVEQKIKEHHGGSISNLQLWKDQVHPKNVLRDFSKTLTEVFQFDDSLPLMSEEELARKKQPDYDCVVFYDFSPHQSECPLLLRSPRLNNEQNNAAGAGPASPAAKKPPP